MTRRSRMIAAGAAAGCVLIALILLGGNFLLQSGLESRRVPVHRFPLKPAAKVIADVDAVDLAQRAMLLDGHSKERWRPVETGVPDPYPHTITITFEASDPNTPQRFRYVVLNVEGDEVSAQVDAGK